MALSTDEAVTVVDLRTEDLLARMTLEQKIHLLHGHVPLAYTVPPIPQLGIPTLKMTDGPAGVNLTLGESAARATALPMPVAVAATWNPAIAARQGELLARELLSHGYNVLLAPNVDVVRQPWWGRAAEQFGEDPLLITQMAAAFIRAVQSYPVIACAKHFILYNQETNRMSGANSVADERALHEIHLLPFAAAVQAGVGSVMSSFNNINHIPASEHRNLLTEVLKDELGFEGWVMSDYGSTASTVASANAGFDQEMPGAAGGAGYGEAGYSHFGGPLLDAVRSGQVSVSIIDDKVRRILRQMFARGLFDQSSVVRGFSETEHALTARQIATETITLLKNEGELLPLSSVSVRSIAVIGGDADHRAATGGASFVSTPTHITTFLAGLKTRAARDGIQVRYAPGTDPVGPTSMLPGPAAVPSSVLTPTVAGPGEHGLKAEYWPNTTFSGPPVLTRTDAQVNLHLGFMSQLFNTSAVPPPPGNMGDELSARWTGTITAPQTGEYRLTLASMGSARLWLNGQLLIDAVEPHPMRVDWSPPLQWESGQPHTLQIEFTSTAHANWVELGDIQLGWTHPDEAYSPAMQNAVALARQTDVAVVFVRVFESEQRDRASLALPNDQAQLIHAVAAANPRTVVVLSCGGPVTMPWIDQVPAIVNAYYAGQEQGAAVADVLFGDVNPSGKLPITFPRSEADVPVADPCQHASERTTIYSEGIFVGYRAYDQNNLEPLFPFGHGLSYTTFAYSNLRLSTHTVSANERLTLHVEITNTGRRAGQEVVQLYLRDLEAGLPRPPKELKGFTKVALTPGESKTVTLSLDCPSLANWDNVKHSWVAEAGMFEVLIGSSS
ncbi:MAG: glycoside hydrolase family 3 C-terminal domain-containing protein, partial [Anaerolineales bacterium]